MRWENAGSDDRVVPASYSLNDYGTRGVPVRWLSCGTGLWVLSR